MAKTILSSNHHDHKPFYVLGVFSVLLSIQEGGAHEFKVGDSNGWAVPSYPSVYNQWAENNRFQISDTLGKIFRAHNTDCPNVCGSLSLCFSVYCLIMSNLAPEI